MCQLHLGRYLSQSIHTSKNSVVVFFRRDISKLKIFPFTSVHLVIGEDSNQTKTTLRKRFLGPFANQS